MQKKVNHYLGKTSEDKMEINQISQSLDLLSAELLFSDFKKKLDYLLDEDIFIGSEDDIEHLSAGTFTLLIDTLFYLVAKDHNLSILPENAVGRGGYSDILICSRDGTNKLIEIEHENLSGHNNKIRKAIIKSLRNLRHSQAKTKVLITYYERTTKNQILNICREYQQKYHIENLYLFFAEQEFDDADEFEFIPL